MAENALREHPNLRIFIAGRTDDPGVGAARAFRNAGIDRAEVYIGGMDGSEQALVDIKKGTYYKATAAIRLDLLGYPCQTDDPRPLRADWLGGGYWRRTYRRSY
ncbi:hypothetical protein [Bradyrhizobium glycinis]|uniref:hypothetical protein n=1 Tax=Bradyrhizobium glycinis TaxID=2751812 RepID=UPI0018D92FF4|nr:hypothetical protein [Bradyrhizobium glycinis]MBH5371121.1 hypothetical protein [Bradyrhizobium glycinis]